MATDLANESCWASIESKRDEIEALRAEIKELETMLFLRSAPDRQLVKLREARDEASCFVLVDSISWYMIHTEECARIERRRG